MADSSPHPPPLPTLLSAKVFNQVEEKNHLDYDSSEGGIDLPRAGPVPRLYDHLVEPLRLVVQRGDQVQHRSTISRG